MQQQGTSYFDRKTKPACLDSCTFAISCAVLLSVGIANTRYNANACTINHPPTVTLIELSVKPPAAVLTLAG